MIWNIDPEIFPFLPVRWYSLMFLVSFLIGVPLFSKLLKRQGLADYKEITEKYFFYVFAGMIVGARLGHVFFYSWNYYSENLLEILQPWKGGLASHGGVLGVIIATIIFFIIYGKRYKLSIWSIFDAIIIPALLASSLIRLGNFCNSEIVGIQTKSGYGVVFCEDIHLLKKNISNKQLVPKVKITKEGKGENGTLPVSCTLRYDHQNKNAAIDFMARLNSYNGNLHFNINDIGINNNGEYYDYKFTGSAILRHPAQLYESAFYLLLFVISLLTYSFLYHYQGACFGIFLGLIFLFRFFIEFIKMNQVAGEEYMKLNIGQRLSIPVVIICIGISIWAFYRK